MGYEPIILLLRNDNLPQAIHACKKGNWTIYTGDQSFDFVKSISNFNLKNFLTEYSGKYSIY